MGAVLIAIIVSLTATFGGGKSETVIYVGNSSNSTNSTN